MLPIAQKNWSWTSSERSGYISYPIYTFDISFWRELNSEQSNPYVIFIFVQDFEIKLSRKFENPYG